eukprot:13641961-Alexandrium_andersonii.AAC.1
MAPLRDITGMRRSAQAGTRTNVQVCAHVGILTVEGRLVLERLRYFVRFCCHASPQLLRVVLTPGPVQGSWLAE